MNCDDVRPLVEAYADDELSLERALEVEAHVATCVDCAARVEAVRALRRVVRDATYHCAPDALRARIAASLGAGAAPKPSAATRRSTPATGTMNRVRRSVPPWMLAVASLVVCVSVGLFTFGRMRTSDATRLSQAIVDRHLASLMAQHLTDVVSSDRHTVKPWFAGKVEFSPPVADLAADGFPLRGGRVDYVSGHPAVALVYAHGSHVINVFVWPTTGPDASAVSSTDARGYQVANWTSGGFAWWAVSDVAAAELADFAGELRAAVAGPPPR